MRLACIVLLLLRTAYSGCLAITGEDIRARDIAHLVPAFTEANPDLILALSPAPGVRRVFSLRDLASAAQRAGVSAENLPGNGICFERALHRLTEQELTEAMLESFPDEPVDIAIVDYSRYGIPAGRLVFQLASLNAPTPSQPNAAVLWRGRVVFAGTRTMEIWARVRITTMVTTCVAVTDILPGKPIEPSQLRMDLLPRFPLRAATVIQSLDTVVGRFARRPIRAGQEIAPQFLEEPKDIRAGDTVGVAAEVGNARVSLDVLAISGGRKGDTVVLRNPTTHASFRAVVDGKDHAVIHADRGGKS